MLNKELRATALLSKTRGRIILGKLLVAILVPASVCATPQSRPTLQITAPSAGAIVSPGQTLTVSVTSPTPASFSQVFLSSGDLTGFLGAISPLPGQLSFTIPSSGFSLGTHRLSAQGTPTSGGALVSTQVSIDVERPDFPSDISSTLPGLQIDSPGEQSRLVLYAGFQDGSTWRVSASPYVTFTSSNTAVATVDSSGLVTSVATGGGFITAVYTVGSNSLQVSIPVNVAAASGAAGGNTSNFIISATPGTESVTPGESASFALSVTSFNGFAGSVALSTGGLPNGITASFTPASVTLPGSSIANFSIPSSAPLGTSTLTIAGNSGSLSENMSVLLTISATPGAPAITTLNPTSGAVGASVTISGVNFGSTQGTSSLTFNATAATPTSWGPTSIVVPVPSGAATGNVVATVGGVASNGVAFTVVPKANITSTNPTKGAAGTSVTITGTNFGTTQGTSTVTFGGIVAIPTSWGATSIVVKVPSGLQKATVNVIANVGGVASNSVSFRAM
jgi:hypothetical protein